ncbi:tyrosine-type recombinase/integrase [Thiomicrorhabdus xiamenensis]|nr:site-specific integrase [Thiomicrorhabdus xiamenensis]
MSLYKQRNSKYWWCKFTAPDGTVIRQSTRTENKALAAEFEATLNYNLYRQALFGERAEMSWREAVVKFITESETKSPKDNISLFRLLDPYFGHLKLHEINGKHIEQLIDTRQKQGVKNSTINKSLEKIRALFNLANKKWRVKCDPPYIKLLSTPRMRVRWITHNEASNLLKHLQEHTRVMAHFTLETGLREFNVTHLRWDQVDLAKGVVYIEGDDVLKDGKPYLVVLTDSAKEIIRSQIGKHHTFVFTYRGKPVKKAGTDSWRNGLEKAGITNFRWHDLRHTWASWHVQNGTPLEVLQELGGWKDIKSVQKYAHFNVDTLRGYAKGLGIVSGIETKKATMVSGF